ncbi:MAG: hypothetical protein LBH92_07855 [Bacteroidales bacterium]|jgi:hypothetical protein|nr:hypothetical protein [Bacteroidales bacterium]
MKRILIAITILLFASISATYAQTGSSNDKDSIGLVQKPSPLRRISLGGNIGGGFTNDYFYLNLQPRISYKATNWFIPGIALMYQYSQEKTGGSDRYVYNTWGVGVFAELYPIKYIYGHVEYQHLWYERDIKPSRPGFSENGNDDYLLLGAGANIPVGNRTYFFASILVDVLKPINSLYKNPIYNVGFKVDL